MAQKLYVGNLPFSVTEDQLRELFGQYGQVISAQVISDRETGRPRGFAFVEMEGAEAAIGALDGQPFGGRNLKVNIAKERQSNGGSQRGGRW